MKVLAIIPARGGSKGVPDKNIYPLLGKPLIQYTIECALKSKKISNIVVSSDSDKIIKHCEDFGVELHKRTEELASDTSPITDTIYFIIEKYEKKNIFFDAVMLLQPTSPIKTGQDIDNAIQLLENNKEINSVISVVEMDDTHPARMYWQNDDDTLNPILSEWEQSRRQDIPKALYRNGVIYLARVKSFKKNKKLMVKPTLPYIMKSKYLLNIDEPRDILIAEPLIKAWQEGNL